MCIKYVNIISFISFIFPILMFAEAFRIESISEIYLLTSDNINWMIFISRLYSGFDEFVAMAIVGSSLILLGGLFSIIIRWMLILLFLDGRH